MMAAKTMGGSLDAVSQTWLNRGSAVSHAHDGMHDPKATSAAIETCSK